MYSCILYTISVSVSAAGKSQTGIGYDMKTNFDLCSNESEFVNLADHTLSNNSIIRACIFFNNGLIVMTMNAKTNI